MDARAGRWTGLACALVLGATVVFWGPACWRTCETVDGLYDAYVQALVHPETFDGWVADNASLFDEEGLQCLDASAQRIADEGARLRQQCDETFVEGSDFWNQCYDEVSDGAAAILGAMARAGRGEVRFDGTEAGIALILTKATVGAERYEAALGEFTRALEEELTEALTCEECGFEWVLF